MKIDIENHILAVAKTCSKEMLQFRQFCCTICHRMFRKKGVQRFTEKTKIALKSECNKNFKQTMERCLSFPTKNAQNLGEYICHTCLRNMRMSKMPALALANQLELRPLPKQLNQLCELELQLLALILPFSKIVGLRGGAYQGVKGESVYVPIEPEVVCNTVTKLPRKLTDAQLIPLKLKRRLRFHGYYMFQTIRKSHVEDGLNWLIRNNPYYKGIKKDPNWFTID